LNNFQLLYDCKICILKISGWLIIAMIEKYEESRSKEAIQLAYLKERLFYDFFKFLKYSQTHSTPQSQTKNSGRKVFRDILNITFKKTSFLWRILFVQKTFKVSFEISFLTKQFSVFWPYNCQIFFFWLRLFDVKNLENFGFEVCETRKCFKVWNSRFRSKLISGNNSYLENKKSRIVFQKNYLFLFTSSRSYLKGECLTLDVHWRVT